VDPPTAGQEETTKRNYKNTSYVEVLDYELKDKETTKRNYKTELDKLITLHPLDETTKRNYKAGPVRGRSWSFTLLPETTKRNYKEDHRYRDVGGEECCAETTKRNYKNHDFLVGRGIARSYGNN